MAKQKIKITEKPNSSKVLSDEDYQTIREEMLKRGYDPKLIGGIADDPLIGGLARIEDSRAIPNTLVDINLVNDAYRKKFFTDNSYYWRQY